MYSVLLSPKLNNIERLNGLVLRKKKRQVFSFTTPIEEGTYYLQFAIQVDCLPPGINSRLIQMKIQKS